MSSTQLARQLAAGTQPPRPTALDAFKLARRKFIAGERIEMQALADELGTSRVTLHRWVGNRDQLLCEIIWSLAEPTLQAARAATRKRGGDGVAETLERFLREVLAAPFMRTFIEREPEIALRILTTARTDHQRRLVSFFRDVVAAEVQAGRLDPPLELDDLAYVIVRIGESFFYADVIARGQPDPGKARLTIAALLG